MYSRLRAASLTVDVEGDSCAFAGVNSQVGGHTAVVSPSVSIDRLDGQVAARGHSLPVWKHLLIMVRGQRKIDKRLKRQIKCCNRRYSSRMCGFSARAWLSFFQTHCGTGSPLHRQTVFKPLDHGRRFSPSRHAAQVVGLPRIQQHLRTPVDHRVIWGDWSRREGSVRKHKTPSHTLHAYVGADVLRTVSLALLDLSAASGA